MGSNEKIEAKKRLSCNTFRLFFASFLSFFIRYAVISLTAAGIYFFVKSEYMNYLLSLYNKYVIYALIFSAFCILVLFSLFVVSGIKLGENFLFFKRAQGEFGSLRLVFSFLSPKKSARAFLLYFKMKIFTAGYFMLYIFPSFLAGTITFYLYNYYDITLFSFYALCAGTGLLLSAGLFFFMFSRFRYGAAPYYMCLENISAKKSIKKSIKHTDGFLCDFSLFRASLFGWLLACILILPAFYAVPYIKLAKACYICNTVSSSAVTSDTKKSTIIFTGLTNISYNT